MTVTPDSTRERARRIGTAAGQASATARGLDDWDDTAQQVAEQAERDALDTLNRERTK